MCPGFNVNALADPFQEARAIYQAHSQPIEGFRHLVKDVVLIASSSRGGSSVFAEYLRRSSAMLHLRAEMNAFLLLAGLGYPDSGEGSDQLGVGHLDARSDTFCGLLSTDVGQPVDHPRGFTDALVGRLALQWPHRTFDVDDVASVVATSVGQPDFHRRLLDRLGLPAAAYDLPLAEQTKQTASLCGPLLEEPPFVCIMPWQAPTPDQLQAMPLIIKTPSNVYRLPFFRGLFPNARFRLVHLVRNPAACINGLIDGWRYPTGFFSHEVGSLHIDGYTGTDPTTSRWWNFDLPPGWQEFRDRPLIEVAAFQWRSAHQHVLAFLRENPVPVHRIQFEDLISSPERARPALQGLFDWLDIEPDPVLADTTPADLPPVMTTRKPRARRWFGRAKALEPMLRTPAVIDLATELGYPPDPSSWE